MLEMSFERDSSAAEKAYWVVAEIDGEKARAIRVRGATPGDAYRQVKEMPGVRRVGKVTDVDPAGSVPRHERPAAAPLEVASSASAGRVALPGQAIAGPRVVFASPPGGGERPFKNLQAPPDRPAPVQPQPAKPAVSKQPAPSVDLEDTSAARDYRIFKSRRRDGEPYFLQRGIWREEGRKRTFTVEWEKGFESREAAERHQSWLQRMEQEIETIDPQAA